MSRQINRRDFLRVSAMSAIGVAVAGCGGGAAP
ncbi:MAG: Tat pathway signal sequence, partial [Caldilineaceae bacterium]|nr:Tat pathway signal sequence [Caldilineaceae bacterium]